MTSLNIWMQGSRPKTLGAALSPVIVGSAIAYHENSFNISLTFLALVVSLSIQIGVNYANDYSDGIKGTDEVRVGPVRLVGQKLASPNAVKFAAIVSFLIATLAGVVLTYVTKQWWLIPLGFSAIVAAWTYTGGPKPYGYFGFGEIFVFLYFGLVAVLGTVYVQTLNFKIYYLIYAIAIGSYAAAILVANNLRDLEKDKQVNKKTLAVFLGDKATRMFYVLLMIIPNILMITLFVVGKFFTNTNLGATIQFHLLALIPAWASIKIVRNKKVGKDLIPVLIKTGQTQLFFAILVSIGLILETF